MGGCWMGFRVAPGWHGHATAPGEQVAMGAPQVLGNGAPHGAGTSLGCPGSSWPLIPKAAWHWHQQDATLTQPAWPMASMLVPRIDLWQEKGTLTALKHLLIHPLCPRDAVMATNHSNPACLGGPGMEMGQILHPAGVGGE